MSQRRAVAVAAIISALGIMLVSSPIFLARADDLKLVPPTLVPNSGTFYSLQKG